MFIGKIVPSLLRYLSSSYLQSTAIATGVEIREDYQK